MDVPVLAPAMTYAQACAAVVDYLKANLPLGAWAVTRVDEGQDRQLFLTLRDDAYGLPQGATLPWSGSLCRRMISEGAPRIAPDAMAIPAYREAPTASVLPIGAWISFPIRRSNGTVFGTLCGADPSRHSEVLTRHGPLLTLLCNLLEGMLDADLACTAVERAVERALSEAETDHLTGLLNRRGWAARLEIEESRHVRFGDDAAIIVIDLDGLKALNDHQGHAAGDDLLRQAARGLSRLVGEHDTIARVGGDEFVVLAARQNLAETTSLVHRLRAGLAAEGVAASLGCAAYLRESGFAGAWHAADGAMYADKRQRSGRNLPVLEAASASL